MSKGAVPADAELGQPGISQRPERSTARFGAWFYSRSVPITNAADSADEYEPRVSADEVARIRQWHERAYQQGKTDGATEQSFDYLGRTLVVPPGVQPVVGMAHVLGHPVLDEVNPEDRVLDMGTGSGVNAVLAASKARSVLAVDVNPVAVAAAAENAVRNGVAERVEVRQSDVFSAVEGKFDLILFDPPFRWFEPRDAFEMATTDHNYRALTTFFEQVRNHLSPGGRVLVSFGTSGDLAYLTHLIDVNGFTAEVVAQDHVIKDGWRVEYYTFRLTVPADDSVRAAP